MMTSSSPATEAASLELSGSTKFRQSCDKCQNSKLRCSRDKPICKRCAQRRFRCVYSPLRRIGRPKKIMETTERVASPPKQMNMDVDVDEEGSEDGSSESLVREASLLSPDSEYRIPACCVSTGCVPFITSFTHQPQLPHTMSSQRLRLAHMDQGPTNPIFIPTLHSPALRDILGICQQTAPAHLKTYLACQSALTRCPALW